MAYVTTEDIKKLFRELTEKEEEKASALIPIVEDTLRQEAVNVDKDIDEMIESGLLLENVFKSVVVDVISRILMSSTNQEPMTQFSQSANGYSFSGSYLSPGGGLYVKRSELIRLGLKKQGFGVINLWQD